MGRVLTWAGCGVVTSQRGQLICDVFERFLQYVFDLLQFVMSLQLSEGSRTDVGQSAASELRNSPCGWRANSGRLLRISPVQFLSYRPDHVGLEMLDYSSSSVNRQLVLCGKKMMWALTKRAARRMSHQKHCDFLERRFFRWRHHCCHPPLWLFRWFQSSELGCDWRAEHLFTTTPPNLEPTPASPLALAAAHTWTK